MHGRGFQYFDAEMANDSGRRPFSFLKMIFLNFNF